MTASATVRDAEAVEERRSALRALLARPLVRAGEPEYALVHRHEHELARTLLDTFGYRLELTSSAARAAGPPTPAGLRRPLRIRPASASGRARPRDEWPALSDRGAVLLFLVVAALERSAQQTAIAELAREVERAGADAEPPITVGFGDRSERAAFADALDLLIAWGVVEHTAGSRSSYSRAQQGDDEALLTVDRRALAMLINDPFCALHAGSVDDLLDERERYAPTAEGDRRARANRLARRLVEDPALVLDDLDDAERAYFLGQRARVEDAVAGATGLPIERRAEGTALIVSDRELTDVPFPSNATIRQLALLLCDRLADPAPLSEEAFRAEVRALLERHQRHWGRDPADPVEVATAAGQARELLCALDLAVMRDGALHPRPLAARFRSAAVRSKDTDS